MDTDKWKSVLVPIEVYKEIKALAQSEGRTISGQLRIIFESILFYTLGLPHKRFGSALKFTLGRFHV
jgi:hypothetical protein